VHFSWKKSSPRESLGQYSPLQSIRIRTVSPRGYRGFDFIPFTSSLFSAPFFLDLIWLARLGYSFLFFLVLVPLATEVCTTAYSCFVPGWDPLLVICGGSPYTNASFYSTTEPLSPFRNPSPYLLLSLPFVRLFGPLFSFLCRESLSAGRRLSQASLC